MSAIFRRLPSISIRYTIPALFVILIVATVALTTTLAFRSGQRAVEDLALRLSREIPERIDAFIREFMDVPFLFHQINAIAARNGSLNLADFEGLRRYFWDQVHITDSVPYMYLGTEKGEFIAIDRGLDGTPLLQIRTTQSPIWLNVSWENWELDANGDKVKIRERHFYDPRRRPWYKDAKRLDRATWSPIYWFASPPSWGITAAMPVYDANGQFYGVYGIDMTLAHISDFMRALEITDTGEAFIIERTGATAGALVAESADEDPFIPPASPDAEGKRLMVTDSTTPLIRATAQALLEHFGAFDQIADNQQVIFEYNGGRQFVQASPFQDGRGLDWLIVVIIPEIDVMGPIFENVRATALLAVLIVVGVVALGMLLARSIVRPVLTMTRVASRIEAGAFELDPLTPVSRRRDELGQLARVFQHMAKEVRAREQQLKQQVQMLRIEIDEVKRASEVKRIVESEFFQELQAKAREARQQRARSRATETGERTAPAEEEDAAFDDLRAKARAARERAAKSTDETEPEEDKPSV